MRTRCLEHEALTSSIQGHDVGIKPSGQEGLCPKTRDQQGSEPVATHPSPYKSAYRKCLKALVTFRRSFLSKAVFGEKRFSSSLPWLNLLSQQLGPKVLNICLLPAWHWLSLTCCISNGKGLVKCWFPIPLPLAEGGRSSVGSTASVMDSHISPQRDGHPDNDS